MPELNPIADAQPAESTTWSAFMESATAWDGAMWAAGLLVIVGGLVVLSRGRSRLGLDPRELNGRMAGPTCMAGGIALMVAGYHVIVWGLPDHFTNLKVPMDLWFVLVGVLAGVVVLVRGMDRLEGARLAGGPARSD